MNSCKHPIVILKDISYRDLSSMLHFMYQGEVNIKQEDISSFLKVAETLQIKGLTTGSDEVFYNASASYLCKDTKYFRKILAESNNVQEESLFEGENMNAVI